MSQKIEFIERATKDGANVSALCSEYGVSRETGHKWLRRFRERGFEGLEEESRRPKSVSSATAEALVLAVIEAREAHPFWGPKKLVTVLQRKWGEQAPSRATIARLLERFGQVRRRRRKTIISVIEHAPDVRADGPNDVWTVDFKGRWLVGDGSRCEPLTVRDGHSRFILQCKAMHGTTLALVRQQFVKLFRKHGVPRAIQCDNGTPFINTQSRGGLTRLSAWWVSLGIRVVRSRLASPQDNGAHERMHREIAEQVEAFVSQTRAAEQRALDRWRHEFNHVRPHEALQNKVPADLYHPKSRRAPIVQRFAYPRHWIIRRVSGPGLFSMNGSNYPVGKAFVGNSVALEPINGLRYRLWFHEVDLGEIEITPTANDIELLVHSQGQTSNVEAHRGIDPAPRRAQSSNTSVSCKQNHTRKAKNASRARSKKKASEVA